MEILCDFHIHTCLSPCGDLDASPSAIVKMAKLAGLDAIAICDHNSALNCPAAIERGQREGVLVIPGIEVATREEAHIIALLPVLEDAIEFSELLYSKLPFVPRDNWRSTRPLDQVYVDTHDVILGEVDKLLIAGADISIEDVIEYVHKKDGLVIPSHIDRPGFSIPSQLGFFPDLNFDAVEVSTSDGMDFIKTLPRKYPVITSSDAHHPKNIGMKYCKVQITKSESGSAIDFINIKNAIRAGHIQLYFP